MKSHLDVELRITTNAHFSCGQHIPGPSLFTLTTIVDKGLLYFDWILVEQLSNTRTTARYLLEGKKKTFAGL